MLKSAAARLALFILSALSSESPEVVLVTPDGGQAGEPHLVGDTLRRGFHACVAARPTQNYPVKPTHRSPSAGFILQAKAQETCGSLVFAFFRYVVALDRFLHGFLGICHPEGTPRNLK